MLPITPSPKKKAVVTGTRGKSVAEWDALFATYIKAYLDDQTSEPSKSLNEFITKLQTICKDKDLSDIDRYSLIDFLTKIATSIQKRMEDTSPGKVISSLKLIEQLNKINKNLGEKLPQPSTSTQPGDTTLATTEFFNNAIAGGSADKAYFAIQYMMAELAHGIAEEMQVPQPTPGTAETTETAELENIIAALKGEHPEFSGEESQPEPSAEADHHPRGAITYVNQATSPTLQEEEEEPQAGPSYTYPSPPPPAGAVRSPAAADVGPAPRHVEEEEEPAGPRETTPLLRHATPSSLTALSKAIDALERESRSQSVPRAIQEKISHYIENIKFFILNADQLTALERNKFLYALLGLISLLILAGSGIASFATSSFIEAVTMLCYDGNPQSDNPSCKYFNITENTQNNLALIRHAYDLSRSFLNYASGAFLSTNWGPPILGGGLLSAIIGLFIHERRHLPNSGISNRWERVWGYIKSFWAFLFCDPGTTDISFVKTASTIFETVLFYLIITEYVLQPNPLPSINNHADNDLICKTNQPDITTAAMGCPAVQLLDQAIESVEKLWLLAKSSLITGTGGFGLIALCFSKYFYEHFTHPHMPPHPEDREGQPPEDVERQLPEAPANNISHRTPNTEVLPYGSSFSLNSGDSTTRIALGSSSAESQIGSINTGDVEDLLAPRTRPAAYLDEPLIASSSASTPKADEAARDLMAQPSTAPHTNRPPPILGNGTSLFPAPPKSHTTYTNNGNQPEPGAASPHLTHEHLLTDSNNSTPRANEDAESPVASSSAQVKSSPQSKKSKKKRDRRKKQQRNNSESNPIEQQHPPVTGLETSSNHPQLEGEFSSHSTEAYDSEMSPLLPGSAKP